MSIQRGSETSAGRERRNVRVRHGPTLRVILPPVEHVLAQPGAAHLLAHDAAVRGVPDFAVGDRPSEALQRLIQIRRGQRRRFLRGCGRVVRGFVGRRRSGIGIEHLPPGRFPAHQLGQVVPITVLGRLRHEHPQLATGRVERLSSVKPNKKKAPSKEGHHGASPMPRLQ